MSRMGIVGRKGVALSHTIVLCRRRENKNTNRKTDKRASLGATEPINVARALVLDGSVDLAKTYG